MTLVVAVTCDDGTVVMGGDSFCGSDHILNTCVADKVYAIGPVGVGLCGSLRSEQILQRVLLDNIPDKKEITTEWLRNELTDAIHDTMKEHGIVHEHEGVHGMDDSIYLVVFDGVVYYLDTDFSMWDSRRPIAAIGEGQKFAYGSMGAMLNAYGRKLPDVEFAENMVRTTLMVAAEWSPWVVPPFKILSVPPRT